MPRSKLLVSFTVLCGALWLAACGTSAPAFECTDDIGCLDIGPDEPIRIGVLQVLSGDLEQIGREQLQGVEVAIASRGGELLGHPIELQAEDTLCSGEGGTTAALKIVADPQIVAILGTTCSGAAVTASKVVSEAGLVMISSSNTAPSLTAVSGEQGADWHPGYYRTAHNDMQQGRAAATFAVQELGLSKAATVNDGDSYTQQLTSVFGQVFTELGGEVVLSTAVNKGDTDMRPVLTSVAASGAEIMFFPIFPPEGNFIALQTQEVEGFDGITLMGADGLLTSPFFDAVGAQGQGMYFVGPDTPGGSAYDAFVSNFEATYGELPVTPFHAHSSDAINLLLEAITAVAVQDAREVGRLHIGRQALRDALSATAGYRGLTGNLSCDQFGDCGASRFKVMRFDDPVAGLEGLARNVVFTYAPD